MFFENILSNTLVNLIGVILPSSRIFYLYLLSAFVIACGSYIWFAAREENARPEGVKKGLLRYIFDPEIWFHKSAKQDYAFFFVNALVYYGVISQLLIGGHVFFSAFGVGLEALFGVRSAPVFEATFLSFAIYTLIAVLAVDFAIYVTHYLQHKVATLWQFHMVHHSAEVLTPMTLYRMHPVDLLFSGLVSGALVSLGLAGFVYLTQTTPTEVTILNVNVIFFAFYMVGYNLRHSHIWVSYPRWLSYIFISPAQHQTHHSIDEKHYDRNFGLVFAFWDWLFGTLYVPKGYEKLEFGVAREEPNPFNSVQEIYLKPFVEAWKIIRPSLKKSDRRVIWVAIIAMWTASYLMISDARDARAQGAVLPSLHLEDLTWTEIAAAQAHGFDTIIIPTGGTEQNGPHVVLGKHYYVVRAASEKIAAELGNTFVAPVLTYVPEGEFGPEKTGHMVWPGTLTLSEPLFEAVLESAARSYHAHGFKNIVFVGDSGGNQEGQAAVAERLSDKWKADGVLIASLSDYYSANGQTEYLMSLGYTQQQIGGHAGIRDTSELLSVAPQGVRSEFFLPPEGWPSGFSGDFTQASAKIGKKMIDLKVAAAVRQFRLLTQGALTN